MILDRGAILEELKLQTEEVPFGKGKVIVTELGANDYSELYKASLVNDKLDMSVFTPKLVARCVVDTEGKRLFTDEDALTLYAGSVKKYGQLAEAARRLNGLEITIEAAAKN